MARRNETFAKQLVFASLGPDCGVKFRIEEQMHCGESTQSGLFDWVQSDLSSVVAVLSHVEDLSFFDAEQWLHTGVTEAGYFTFTHDRSMIVSLHDARVASFPSVEAACEAVS